jgi:sporulation protein YlmC with PRC-barrel domain
MREEPPDGVPITENREQHASATAEFAHQAQWLAPVALAVGKQVAVGSISPGKTRIGGTMDANTLKNMAIVSLEEGAKLGRVEQPLFDLAARQLRALEVHGDDGTFIVPFEQIESIGSDAITVASSQVTHAPSSGTVGTLMSLHDLQKLKVVDNSGTFLGTLDTVEFDAADGSVTQLSAHKGGMLGMGGTTTQLVASSILVVGSELLTVTTDAGSTAPAT